MYGDKLVAASTGHRELLLQPERLGGRVACGNEAGREPDLDPDPDPDLIDLDLDHNEAASGMTLTSNCLFLTRHDGFLCSPERCQPVVLSLNGS